MTGAETCWKHAPVPHHTHTIGGRARMAVRESISLTPEEHARVMARVEIDRSTNCWNWIADINGTGYAQVRLRSSRYTVHRVLYEHAIGRIPAGLSLDHLCRNRRCVNPAHLEPVTHRENVLRGQSPAAEAAKATHCKAGHEYTPENTRITLGVYGPCRVCRACTRHWSRVVASRKRSKRQMGQEAIHG